MHAWLSDAPGTILQRLVNVSTPSAVVRLYVGDRNSDDYDEPAAWHTTDELRAPDLVEYYLGLERLTCCYMSGGFFISADDKPWNHECIDEISMAETWLPAIEQLLRGAGKRQVWAWEESNMTLIRDGDHIELSDVHHAGSVVCAPVRFELRAFAEVMLHAAKPMADLAARVHAYLDAQTVEPHGERYKVMRNNITLIWRKQCDSLAAALASGEQDIDEPAPAPLFRAIRYGDEAWLTRLLDDDPTLANARDNRVPALHVAVDLRNVAVARLLLARGAEVDRLARAMGIDRRTALHAAAHKGLVEMIALLVDHGASLEARDGYGFTPLEWASAGSFDRERPAATLLLERGATLTLRAAMMLGRRQAVAALAAQVAQAPDIFTQWVRHMSFGDSRHEKSADDWRATLQGLIDAGGDIDAVAKPIAHRSALAEAAERPRLVALLRELGAKKAAPKA